LSLKSDVVNLLPDVATPNTLSPKPSPHICSTARFTCGQNRWPYKKMMRRVDLVFQLIAALQKQFVHELSRDLRRFKRAKQ
jgi:hypothetical protein